jgi:BlaI family penicillinase repressor
MAMKKKSLGDLGELQRAVIEIIWELGRANVHQVRERLASSKTLAYTTVLTTLQKLEKAGWLTHKAEGRSYVYLPTGTRDQAGAGSLRKFIKHVFDGDAMLMFQHLIRETNLKDDELREIREMINSKRKENRK